MFVHVLSYLLHIYIIVRCPPGLELSNSSPGCGLGSRPPGLVESEHFRITHDDCNSGGSSGACDHAVVGEDAEGNCEVR